MVAFELMRRARASGRKVAFLAQEVPLVFQQGRACQRFTKLKVGKYCGDEQRLAEYGSTEACFFTAGLFLHLLEIKRVAITDFALVVFSVHRFKNEGIRSG